MSRIKVGDLVIPRKQGGMIKETQDPHIRELKAGEESKLFLVMQAYRDDESNLLEMPQFKVRLLNGVKELWYYERDLVKIIKGTANGN